MVDLAFAIVICGFLLCEHVPGLFFAAFVIVRFYMFCIGIMLFKEHFGCMSVAYRWFTTLLFITQTATFGATLYAISKLRRHQ